VMAGYAFANPPYGLKMFVPALQGEWSKSVQRYLQRCMDIQGLRHRQQSRLRKFEQVDKWSFCLTAGTLVPANQERR